MHIHILGVCGTFMGSLAQLAIASGHRVTGSDANVYAPMSTQLEAAGIELIEGFNPDQLEPVPDVVVVGNVVSRSNPVMEAVLDRGIPYVSGPQWLAENILHHKWVLAIAGTHGKTTTSSMLAWILDFAGYDPSFLIGGVPGNFPVSARLTESSFFVIEADEYDTAFFDKRSKFVHYRPRTLVLNNLEFDHADIFPDLAAIQTQFHHLIRTVPRIGMVIYRDEMSLDEVVAQGCWSDTQLMSPDAYDSGAFWQYQLRRADGGIFDVVMAGQVTGTVHWPLSGEHNVHNAISAIAAARHVGVQPDLACEALSVFQGVKRRMELVGEVSGVYVYDDFAHHPTAIASTLQGLRAKVGDAPIVAIIESRSNTMKKGIHRQHLLASVAEADTVCWHQADNLDWNLGDYVAVDEASSAALGGSAKQKLRLHYSQVFDSTESILDHVVTKVCAGSHIVIMSNGGFDGIHKRLITRLEQL